MSSQSEVFGSWDVADIEELAKWQRNTLWILAALILSTAAMFVSMTSSGLAVVIFSLRIAISVFCIYFVYKFASSARQTGILYAIAMLFPLIGLLALLCLNSTATSILQKNGVHVGIMGATQEDIERLKIQALVEQPMA